MCNTVAVKQNQKSRGGDTLTARDYDKHLVWFVLRHGKSAIGTENFPSVIAGTLGAVRPVSFGFYGF
jgi:hypothetical protein